MTDHGGSFPDNLPQSGPMATVTLQLAAVNCDILPKEDFVTHSVHLLLFKAGIEFEAVNDKHHHLPTILSLIEVLGRSRQQFPKENHVYAL